jgi:hypothetical protein
MKQEFPSTEDEAFEASIVGAYYREQMNRMKAEGRITHVPFDPAARVDTWWDLGIDDEMVVIFVQTVFKEVHVIDLLASSDRGLDWFAKQLQIGRRARYVYGDHFAPHDIKVRELSDGKTRIEKARELGISFTPANKIPIADGIEAVRSILDMTWIDKDKCAKLVDGLTHYQKEYDERLATFKNQPLHDWASHYADAFRSGAVMHQFPIKRDNGNTGSRNWMAA